MAILYHLQLEGGASLRTIAPAGGEAFVHLCTAEQLEGVWKRFFEAQGRSVIAYQIDPAALDRDKLIEEDSYGHGSFPHYYGEIPEAAIVGRGAYPI